MMVFLKRHASKLFEGTFPGPWRSRNGPLLQRADPGVQPPAVRFPPLRTAEEARNNFLFSLNDSTVTNYVRGKHSYATLLNSIND